MEALRMVKSGQTFTRGPEFGLSKLNATVLHERQFRDIPEAQPGDDPCPAR